MKSKEAKNKCNSESESVGLLAFSNKDEYWKPIESAETFEVSNMGRVRSTLKLCPVIISPQNAKRTKANSVRLRVYLDRRKKFGWCRYLYIHNEVAKAFTAIKGKVGFRDGNPFNCKVENLCSLDIKSDEKDFSNMDVSTEKWKYIHNNKFVQVSNMGRVRKLCGSSHELQVVRIWQHPKMNNKICVANIRGKSGFVHNLVAKTFLPNPNNHRTVKFKNDDTTDCRVENLEWQKESKDYKYIQALHDKQEKSESEMAIDNWINDNCEAIGNVLERETTSLLWKLKYRLGVDNHADVEDAIQYAMLEVLERSKRGLVKKDISGYAYTVARNKIYRISKGQIQSLYGISINGKEFLKTDLISNNIG